MFKYKDLCNLTSNSLYLRYDVSKQKSSLVEEEEVIRSPIRKLLLFRKEVNLTFNFTDTAFPYLSSKVLSFQ